MLTQIPFLLRESIRGWWYHRASTWPVLLTVFFSTYMLMASSALVFALQWGSSEDSPLSHLRLFLKEQIPDSQLGSLSTQIQHQFPAIQSVKQFTRAQALQEFRHNWGSDIIADLDTNPLPASLDLQIRAPWRHSDSLQVLLRQFQSLSFVDGSSDPSLILAEIEKRRQQLFWSVSGVAIAVFVALWLILSNAVRLSLESRRILVENLHILGANTFMLVTPFALESLSQTLVGGLIAGILAWLTETAVTDYSGLQLPLNSMLFLWMGIIFLTSLLSIFVTWWTLKGFLVQKSDRQ